jgi:hypothetical protein
MYTARRDIALPTTMWLPIAPSINILSIMIKTVMSVAKDRQPKTTSKKYREPLNCNND